MDKRKRIFGLDLIRSYAIFLVLICHSSFFLRQFYPKMNLLGLLCGYLGVEIFFVLSGFLIGRILINLISRGWNVLDLIKFLISRLIRILPNYYLFLIGYILLYSKLFSLNCFDIRYFLFLQNFFSPHPSFFPEAWALSVEGWFYIIFPSLVFIFSFKKRNYQKTFIIISAILIILCEVLRFFYVYIKNPPWDEGIRKIVIFRLDAPIIGSFIAYISYYFPKLSKKYIYYLGFIGFFICIFFYIKYDVNKSFFMKTFYFFITDISFAFILPFFFNLDFSFSYITVPITFISNISYCLYLVNLSLVYIPLSYYLHIKCLKTAFLGFSLYWILTFCFAILIYQFYERPIMEYRHKIVHSFWQLT